MRKRFKTIPHSFPVAYITLLLIISAASFSIALNENERPQHKITEKTKVAKVILYLLIKDLFYKGTFSKKILEKKANADGRCLNKLMVICQNHTC